MGSFCTSTTYPGLVAPPSLLRADAGAAASTRSRRSSAAICKHRRRCAVRPGSRHPCSGLFCHCFPIDSRERRHCSLCAAQSRESVGQIIRFPACAPNAHGVRALYFHCCLQWRLPFCCIALRTALQISGKLHSRTITKRVFGCASGTELTGIYRRPTLR